MTLLVIGADGYDAAMMTFSSSISDTLIEDHIRGRQMHRLEQSLVYALCGFMLGIVITCLLFWKEWAFVLEPWGIVSFAACLARLYSALFVPTPMVCSLREFNKYHVLDAALSIILASGPLYIAFYSEGAITLYMAVITSSIIWAGALVYLSVFQKAAIFIVVQITLWAAMILWTGRGGSKAELVILIYLIAIVALAVCHRVSRWLKEGLRQQCHLEVRTSELQRQTETISLLLREHESETSDWLWQTDASMKIQNVSARFTSVFGHFEQGIEGLFLSEVLYASGVPGNAEACGWLEEQMQQGLPFRASIVPGAIKGEGRWWSVSGRSIEDTQGVAIGYRGVMTDVTAEQKASIRINHLAHFDPLTDLPNRVSFLQRLETRLANLEDRQLAVLYLDLDGFKLVNDRFGHAIGDALLVAVARRLQDATSNNDLVARLSGDEFVVKVRFTSQEALNVLCKRLLKSLNQPYEVAEHDIAIGASLGVALAPIDGKDATVLLKNADAALYRAKRDGRGTYRFFASDLDQELQERAVLLQDLRHALSRDELALHYQPFVDAVSGAVTGYEALIRWWHPKRGLVSPLDFVPLAEDSGLIVPIGSWVIRTACAEAATWSDDRRVSVNISPVQFNDHELPDLILKALVETGLPARCLEIELTENIFVSNIDHALSVLRRIRALGVRVALDDFGTGYSSLSYLQSFPFDKIKIDRAFVRDLNTRSDSQVIVRAVGDIARGLNMSITAEGVETQDQANLLKISGCHELQGYLYGRPTPPENLAITTAEASIVWARAQTASA